MNHFAGWAVSLALCAAWPAHACDVAMPQPETPGIAWDYWWSGACEGGLASGPGFLFEFMKGAGFGDIYAGAMERGRLKGRVVTYGPTFAATEWHVHEGEWPGPWERVDDAMPRHMLPLALQETINRFAKEAGHAQLPALPVQAGAPRCPDEGLQFVQSQPSFDDARKIAIVKAMEQPTPVNLRLASAVVGCRSRPW